MRLIGLPLPSVSLTETGNKTYFHQTLLSRLVVLRRRSKEKRILCLGNRIQFCWYNLPIRKRDIYVNCFNRSPMSLEVQLLPLVFS